MTPRYASSETNRVVCGLGDFIVTTCYEEAGQPEQGAEPVGPTNGITRSAAPWSNRQIKAIGASPLTEPILLRPRLRN